MSGRVGVVVEQCWHRVPGGTAFAALSSVEALVAHSDWQVVGVAAVHRRRQPELAAAGLEVHHMALPRLVLYESWQRLRWPTIQSRSGKLDVVHASGGVVPPAGDAALVVTVNDLAFMHYPEFFSRRGVSFMSRAFALAKRYADLVMVPSVQTLQDCVEHGIGRDRLRLVPLGATPQVVSESDRAEVRVRYGLPERFLLWVGTNEPRKNLESLLSAFALSNVDLPLILVGPSGWSQRSKKPKALGRWPVMKGRPKAGKSTVSRLTVSPLTINSPTEGLFAGQESKVRHIGEVSRKDLSVLYDLAEVFIYPSLMEGFGLPILEAMAQGTPVITSKGGATEEVAGGAAELVDPHNVESIADGIAKVVGDSQLREKLALAGAKRSSGATWQHTAEAISACYEEVSC